MPKKSDHETPATPDQLDPAKSDVPDNRPRDGAQKRRDRNEPAAVVGIGASAGGIAPLQVFFEEMQPDSGLAFVVVMHLSPDFESQLTAVLQQKTEMPVVQVSEPVKVLANHVYVIPPSHQLTFEDGLLRLVPPQQERGRRVTIDLFFRTLASAYGQRAVSIILSGTDSDGVIGLKHIRAQGGVTVAQEPAEAEFDSMPQNAVATGMVDWVLRVGDMPQRLLEFVRNEDAMQLPPEIIDAAPGAKVKDAPGGETISEETRDPDDEEALALVLKHVRAHTNHDFAHYKRATVLRRIARRLQVNSLDSIPNYLEFLRQHPAEVHALLSDLLIGVTHFFRDPDAFAALEANVPQLFAGKRAADEVRVWVAGCATGEEAYSIAMLLCEYAERLAEPPAIQIFATDIDQQAINDARSGRYPLTIEADVSQQRLRQFCTREAGRYRVKKDLRDKVLFATHNVLSDPAFSRIDVVSCRNLLIYLNQEAQAEVFDVFHFSLRPGGLLFVGGAESADHARELFAPLDSHHRIYSRRSIPRSTWKLPAIPERIAPPRSYGDQPRPMLRKMASGAVETAGEQTQTATYAGQQRRSVLFGELHLKLLEEYGPPSVVVNEAHDIVHLSEHAGRYLTFRAGEPSTNLLTVVNPALRIELRTALFRAAQSNQSVIVPGQRVPIEGGSETIDLHVRPIRPGDAAQGFFLILFEKKIAPATEEEEAVERETISRQVGDELQSLKGQLNSTVEQFEASSEELKASNEELQAMNEELRSAAEELETSKEELQSVNEELITVNQELKEKVEQLSRANSDLNALMSSTDLATIFLDRQFRVVRFTPRIQEMFNLLPADVGRPLSDITNKLHYDELGMDAQRVLDRLVPVERELPTEDGRSFLARIAPYRTLDDKISGVVVTLIDVTQIKRAQDEVRAISHEMELQAHRFDTIMQAVPDFIYEFDLNGRFTYVNPALLQLWGLTAEEAIGKNFHQLDYTRELATKLQRQIQEVIDTRAPLKDETPYTSKIGERMYEYLFFPIFGEGGKVEAVAGVTRDITQRRQAEAALRASEERFRNVADNVPQMIWTNDAEGNADYFNKRWFDYTGLSSEESFGPGWQAIVHPDDEAVATERWTESLRKGEVFEAEYRLRGADGEYRWFIGRNVPLRTEGQVLSWFGSATDIDDVKRAQVNLTEAEEKFRLLVEGAPDYAMFLLDTENNITYWSSGAEQVFQWTPEEAIGEKGSMIFIGEDLAKGEDRKELAQASRHGAAPDRRWHKRKDGTRLWLDGFMRRLNHEDGALRGFAKVAREATDQKIAEEKLRNAYDDLEQRVHDRTKELQAMNETLEQEMMRRQRLESEILQVTERERARISQDLHDTLCQELTATAFLMKSRARSLGRTDPEAGEALTEAAEAVNRNAGLARDLARGMHPLELGPGGLVAALRELASRTSETVTCKCECPRSLRVPSESVALNLYRIAQEAVTNALKHGKPTEVVICIERLKDVIHLVITDNGTPHPRKKSSGLGIQMMQYRASVSGGTLRVEFKRDKGTRVICRVPTKQAAE